MITFFEIIGFLTGLISIYYSVKENRLTWLYGILSCVSLMFLFFLKDSRGQVIFQFYSFIQCFIGWKYWSNDDVKIKLLTKRQTWLVFGVVAFFGLIVYPSYNNLPEYLDGLILYVGLVAIILLSAKYLISWYFYMIVNLLTIGLCLYQECYLVVILNILYFIMSIWGLKSWKKSLKTD